MLDIQTETSPAQAAADATIKLNYTKRLIPLFCKVFLNCMIQSINKACLNLLRKLIGYAPKDHLSDIVRLQHADRSVGKEDPEAPTICTLLVELVAKILQENQNYESIFVGLSVSSDLFRKCAPSVIEEFTRLGVGQLISKLAVDSAPKSSTDEASDEENNKKSPPEKEEEEEEVSEIVANEAYTWNNEWCLVCCKDFVYIWSGFVALELSHNSNGWFRFLLDDKLFSMYSNGKPEVSSETDENKAMFAGKLVKAKQTVDAAKRCRRIFIAPAKKTAQIRHGYFFVFCFVCVPSDFICVFGD